MNYLNLAATTVGVSITRRRKWLAYVFIALIADHETFNEYIIQHWNFRFNLVFFIPVYHCRVALRLKRTKLLLLDLDYRKPLLRFRELGLVCQGWFCKKSFVISYDPRCYPLKNATEKNSIKACIAKQSVRLLLRNKFCNNLSQNMQYTPKGDSSIYKL